MEKRLFTTASSRPQRSVHATQRENYKTLVGQIGVLDPKKIDHKNPRFVEDEVKSLCGTLRLNKQQTHLAYIEFKASGGRSIPDQLNKLMVAIDILSSSNAEYESEFSANRTNEREMESRAIRKNLAWKGKKSCSFNKWHGSTNDIKLDDPKLRDCAHFILFLVTLGRRPHSSAFLWHWQLVRSSKKVG